MLKKVILCILISTVLVPAQAQGVNVLAAFVKEVLTQVAASVLADVIKDQLPSNKPTQPPVVSASADDRTRTKSIISALTDTTTPLPERIGLYATRVDFFADGIVDHAYILRDRLRFESRWPNRKYTIRSIDEIAVAPDRTYVIARYTVDFHVSRGEDSRDGTTHVAVLIGSFNAQPRVHAVKEWVQHHRQ